MRTLKTEVEKGSMWTAIGHGWVGPKTYRKWMEVGRFAAAQAEADAKRPPRLERESG